ncbi:hypothetical protein DWX43_16115 [Clostridium sp. AF19-22AC]|jgi:hypothetical protein|uniref:hypothetical protein n=1 Tax=Clostridia TaxID=186801 RepID=UPI000E4B4DE8|nr:MULTISPECIES: hypothetical protein [Clostridia]RHR26215.1 hypothetical protein DWX43_16115 [Clostridium sp. AF19-22AC]
MKKGRIIGVFTLALTLLPGMQVHAEENSPALTLDVSAPAGMSGTSAKAGDTLTFSINLGGVKGKDNLGGSYLRFRVASTQNVDDAVDRIGDPEMTSNCSYISNGGKAKGLTTLRLDANIKDLDGNAEVVVTLPVTNDMKGKTLYYKVDLRPDSGGIPGIAAFAETDVRSVSVEDSADPEESDQQITLTAQAGADMSKLEKGKVFPIELTVTNPNPEALPHVYIAAGYSEKGMYDEEGNDTGVEPEPLGSFAGLPNGVTQPEAGAAYIPTLAAGASVTLKLNAVIPETYGKESIVFSYAAISFADENQEEPLAAAIIENKGTIVKPADVPQDPEKPAPGKPDPETTKPIAGPSGQNQPEKQTPVFKTPSPKTGDTMTTAGVLAVLIVLMGSAGVIAELSRKHIRK